MPGLLGTRFCPPPRPRQPRALQPCPLRLVSSGTWAMGGSPRCSGNRSLGLPWKIPTHCPTQVTLINTTLTRPSSSQCQRQRPGVTLTLRLPHTTAGWWGRGGGAFTLPSATRPALGRWFLPVAHEQVPKHTWARAAKADASTCHPDTSSFLRPSPELVSPQPPTASAFLCSHFRPEQRLLWRWLPPQATHQAPGAQPSPGCSSELPHEPPCRPCPRRAPPPGPFPTATAQRLLLVVLGFAHSWSPAFVCYRPSLLYTFLQMMQPAISVEKLIVKTIISNKWYTGQYKDVSCSFLGMLPSAGGGGSWRKACLCSRSWAETGGEFGSGHGGRWSKVSSGQGTELPSTRPSRVTREASPQTHLGAGRGEGPATLFKQSECRTYQNKVSNIHLIYARETQKANKQKQKHLQETYPE